MAELTDAEMMTLGACFLLFLTDPNDEAYIEVERITRYDGTQAPPYLVLDGTLHNLPEPAAQLIEKIRSNQ